MQIFVYGTLRPGGRFWPRVARSVRRVGPTGVLAAHTLFAGDTYPLAAPTPTGWGTSTGVVGEPLEVDEADAEAVLGVLDGIEGAPELFQRTVVGDRVLGELWVYVATPDTLRATAGGPVPSGDWFDVDRGARAAWESVLAAPYSGPTCRYGEP